MARSVLSRTLTATALVLALSACGGEAGSDAEPAGEEPAIIDERQENLEQIGDAFKAIRSELEVENADVIAIGEQAGIIKANAVKVGDHFPEGTGMDDGYDTEALATIWKDPEGFTAAHQALVDASEGLAAAAESGDLDAVKAQIPELGKSCKGCHDKFRVDKD